jgi:hypothetical protein
VFSHDNERYPLNTLGYPPGITTPSDITTPEREKCLVLRDQIHISHI